MMLIRQPKNGVENTQRPVLPTQLLSLEIQLFSMIRSGTNTKTIDSDKFSYFPGIALYDFTEI